MGRFLLPCGNGRLRAAQIVGNAKLGGVVSSILNYYSHIDDYFIAIAERIAE